jgi:DNA-binding NtrC family response regulator
MAESDLLTGKKILIVDDETDILETLEESLSMCKVVRASTFVEAKEMLESGNFDVAILDIMGVRGYDLLKIANLRNIPALMLTAHAFTPDNMIKSVKEGAVSYVPKEEMGHIEDFLKDIFAAKAKGESPWVAWQKRLPSSYFQTRFGAAWKNADQEFLKTLKSAIKNRPPAENKDE